ncbi:MAG: hypothetical protein PHN92_01760 [Geobacter sp.]|nr:hypothetical protein [Geobacter sp.]
MINGYADDGCLASEDGSASAANQDPAGGRSPGSNMSIRVPMIGPYTEAPAVNCLPSVCREALATGVPLISSSWQYLSFNISQACSVNAKDMIMFLNIEFQKTQVKAGGIVLVSENGSE